jgi:chemotaxis protein methyltransferase CheR
LFHLAGGDIDKNALNKARTARYTEFSFRSLSPQLRDRYFEQHSKWAWDVAPDVRQQVHFHHLNLLDASYHHALQDYDFIFFRNVSIYFDAPTRRLIQQHLAALLKNDGCLIIGTTETLANDFGILNLVEENGQFYFAKQPVAAVVPHHDFSAAPASRNSATDWISSPPLSSPPRAVEPYVAPPAPPQPTITATIDEALRLTQEKRHEQAMNVLDILLEQQSTASAALLLKAYILLHRKDYAAAAESAEQVLKIDAWSIDAFVLLGLAAKWRERMEDAAKWFKQAVYARNECWPAHFYLAEIYRANNETEKAQRAYRAVLNLLSGQHEIDDGLSIIPLDLPTADVRFLCEHQAAKLGGRPVALR